MAAKTVGKWAASSGYLNRLIGDALWGGGKTQSIYITPNWSGTVSIRIKPTFWETGAAVVGVSVAEHARGGIAERVSGRAKCFLPKFHDTFHSDGSVVVDATNVLNLHTFTDRATEVAHLGRVDLRWLQHASLKDLSWLLSRDGVQYDLKSASFATGKYTLGDALTCTWICPGKVRFTPRTEITTTIHTAKTRQFAGFCHALLYNFPELLVLSVPTGTLTSYMERPPHHTRCVLNDSGKNLTVCTKNNTQPITPVNTMVDCDQVASRALFAQVHCAAHPTMTRITQIWTGTCRWKPRAQALKKIASRLRHTAGIIKRDQRSQSRNYALVTHSLELVLWRDIRRIRATSPYVSQTLYRLKCNRFPLWNRSANNLSCPAPECSSQDSAPVVHIFWECPIAERRWRCVCEVWSRIGRFTEAELPVNIFSLELSRTPERAWVIAQASLNACDRTLDAREACYEASTELWRFVVSITFHTIWLERLRRIEDPTLSVGTHHAVAQSRLRRALSCFRNSTYQPGGGTSEQVLARVRSALADDLLQHTEAPILLLNAQPAFATNLYLLFFNGGSRGNPGPGGSGSVIVCVHPQTHAATIVWMASISLRVGTTTNNSAGYNGLIQGLRQAKHSELLPLYVIGDNVMVLNQLRGYRSPRKSNLSALYRQARALADDVSVASWAHHIREYNMMAAVAANTAMNTKTTLQVHDLTDTNIYTDITHHIQHDVNHWLETSVELDRGSNNRNMQTTRERALPAQLLVARRTAPHTVATSLIIDSNTR